ncbi:DUF3293 domain-containing protein [Wenzhouxiangella marina]|uniref:Uncharacterized protein n=1 Tax=Wenzhouxiangella marina TaxID=1579979 RepID=A0A0K0XV19_9GAMM|nr:DUF3293 domain-containing protein [Wenzhouxiangella marina]AKS41559.1 hypothetical protein WM2015_1185 [Wenzhouxiangella marina]MBB6086682.1 hypothetical protein [Wenzhouxiangella marina]
MTERSSLPAALDRVYRSAIYRVFGESYFAFRIDRFSPELAAWQVEQGVEQSAFLTACNPASRQLGEGENRTRQALLLDALGHLPCMPGQGEDPSGRWPAEASVLVAGLDPDEARALGLKFGQAAVVHIGHDAIPRLLAIPETLD